MPCYAPLRQAAAAYRGRVMRCERERAATGGHWEDSSGGARVKNSFEFPILTLFGSRSAYELTCVRGWDKNLPSRILGALPKRSWLKRLRKLACDVLVPLWRHIESMSPATRSRWQWTWVWDDSVFRKYGQDFELVGTWYSGRVPSGCG
jgi:hypothetical protein